MPKNTQVKADQADKAEDVKPEGDLFNFPEHGVSIRAGSLEEATAELKKRFPEAK